MPGLLRGIARVAVASGTATAVSNRVSRRQSERWAGQGAPAYMAQTGEEPAPQEPMAQQPMAAPPRDPIEQLKELGELRQQGILTDEEFAAQKAKLLGT
jgi:hypothetical protein